MLNSFWKTVLLGLALLLVSGGMAYTAVTSFALRSAPQSTVRAISITRELAKDWTIASIRPRYAALAASRLDDETMQRRLDDLSRLGRLVAVADAAQSHFSMGYSRRDGLIATSRIALDALFENGDAKVILTFRLESGATLLETISIEPTAWHEPGPKSQPVAPRPRSFA